jgi:hypothetical protein
MKTFMYLAGNTRIKKEYNIKYCYVITNTKILHSLFK